MIAFLRALERTGQARAAAKDAGIDHSTAYARRRAHPDFAERWAAALAAHAARVKAEEDAAIEAVEKAPPSHPSPGSPAASPTSPLEGRGEFLVSGGKVRRVGHGRWGKEKERIFFEVLAGTASIRLAADAAGVSTNAILARRNKSRLFAAKVDAVVQNAKVVIDLYLIEQAKRTFDPDELDIGDERPAVTIDQAIKISQMLGSRLRGSPANPFHAEDAASEDDDSLTEQLVVRIRRFRERVQREQMAAGWTRDESFDAMIPPGYIKGPDYKPKRPEPPVNDHSKCP